MEIKLKGSTLTIHTIWLITIVLMAFVSCNSSDNKLDEEKLSVSTAIKNDSMLFFELPCDPEPISNQCYAVRQFYESMQTVDLHMKLNAIKPITIIDTVYNYTLNTWQDENIMKCVQTFNTTKWHDKLRYQINTFYVFDQHNWLIDSKMGRTQYDSINEYEPFDTWELKTFYDSTLVNCISQGMGPNDTLVRNCITFKGTWFERAHYRSYRQLQGLIEQLTLERK